MNRPTPDERDPRWVAYLAAREAERHTARRRAHLVAAARAQIDAQAELARLRTRAAIPDLTVLRDARIGDWRAVLDAQIHRDEAGAWTTAPVRRERRRTA